MTNTLPKVAYFCMEYGLHQDFKMYAGGLGILAGDYIKGAKQYDYPMVALGIKWKQGYTDQLIGEDSQPYDTYHNYDYDFLEDTGVVVNVEIRSEQISCKVWKTETFDNVPLYLLDTDIPENSERWITGQLYGWFGEERLAQEIVLGVGGIRALRKLGIDIDIYHFNEGHALFAGFELIQEKKDKGLSHDEAISKTKQEVVFTTHTPIVQGNESHPLERMIYMGANLGMTEEQLEELGGSPFNMTVGALRLAKIANSVAQLHGDTSNKMWQHIDNRAEIIAITNAIHLPTWVDDRIIPAAQNDDDITIIHQENKQKLVDYIKEKNGVSLNPDKLIIGFSRRAAPYKRSDFIFSSPEIIDPYLENQDIQIVFSGKAHPFDDVGKGIVTNLVEISKKYPNSVVFLENYGMEIGSVLTRGADVWLNNPRRPLEASGTSGMKASMNGVLNFSILDGWWPEACNHGVNGWQFGDGFESDDDSAQDKHDLESLYRTLLDEVVPTFYNDKDKWQQMMKASILDTFEYFDVKRMLDEYYTRMYKL